MPSYPIQSVIISIEYCRQLPHATITLTRLREAAKLTNGIVGAGRR